MKKAIFILTSFLVVYSSANARSRLHDCDLGKYIKSGHYSDKRLIAWKLPPNHRNLDDSVVIGIYKDNKLEKLFEQCNRISGSVLDFNNIECQEDNGDFLSLDSTAIFSSHFYVDKSEQRNIKCDELEYRTVNPSSCIAKEAEWVAHHIWRRVEEININGEKLPTVSCDRPKR